MVQKNAETRPTPKQIIDLEFVKPYLGEIDELKKKAFFEGVNETETTNKIFSKYHFRKGYEFSALQNTITEENSEIDETSDAESHQSLPYQEEVLARF